MPAFAAFSRHSTMPVGQLPTARTARLDLAPMAEEATASPRRSSSTTSSSESAMPEVLYGNKTVEDRLFEATGSETDELGRVRIKGTVKFRKGHTYHGQWTEHKLGGERTYHGQWLEKKLDGEGEMVWANGERYVGQFSADLRTGRGRMQYADGSVYEGDWSFDQRAGRGTHTVGTPAIGNGGELRIFTGEWRDDMHHRVGKATYASGDTFEGRWAKGKRCDGDGDYVWADGTAYTGGFRHELRHGAGHMRYLTGDTYVGQWEGGMRCGRGAIAYIGTRGGDRFDGSWAYDERLDGEGTMNYADGAIYHGMWRSELRQGPGVFTSEAGDLFTGEWLNDLMEGQGVMNYSAATAAKSGSVSGTMSVVSSTQGDVTSPGENGVGAHGLLLPGTFTGPWRAGLPDGDCGQMAYRGGVVYTGAWKAGARCDGPGTATYADGSVYNGEWVCDRHSGVGVLTEGLSNGAQYNGQWTGGLRHGDGCQTYTTASMPHPRCPKHEIQFDGKFENGRRALGCVGSMGYSDGSTYTGEWDDERMHDTKGALVFSNGDIYTGPFAQGRMLDGVEATMSYHPDSGGGRYVGQWKAPHPSTPSSQNITAPTASPMRHGMGKMAYNAGDIFDGTWADDTRLDGPGRMTYACGDVYSGGWVDEDRDGVGEVTYTTGDIYKGQWAKDTAVDGRAQLTYGATGDVFTSDLFAGEDRRDGHGVMVYSQPNPHGWCHYEGPWTDMQKVTAFTVAPDGKSREVGPGPLGTMTYADGTEFTGGWDGDHRPTNGYGVATYPDGTKYQGQFRGTLRSGTGQAVFADGAEYDGDWNGDIMDGVGTCQYAMHHPRQFNLYHGQWLGGKFHGKGSMSFNTFDTYRGQWEEGNMAGEGEMKYATEDTYSGGWLLHGRSGYGVIKYCNGDTYSGQWDNDSRADGKGKLSYAASGESYEGEWRSCLRDGEGVMVYQPSGNAFKGLWSRGKRVEDEGQYCGYKEGKGGAHTIVNTAGGVMAYANGDVYTGQWSLEKRSGRGVMVYATGPPLQPNPDGNESVFIEGDTYEGLWEDDKPVEGNAKYTFGATGDVYRGEFDNQERPKAGYGEMEFQDGGKYEGEWKGPHRHGKGTMAYADGSTFSGNFERDERQEGDGFVEFPDGGKYNGQWARRPNLKTAEGGSKAKPILVNVRHGEGRMIFSNGDTYNGRWTDDLMQGEAAMVYANGDQYHGQWLDGHPHWYGTLFCADGSKYEGGWAGGGRAGRGTWTSLTETYFGEWQGGERHGYGECTVHDVTSVEITYRGGWLRGTHHGEGRLTYRDGDFYTGAFTAGVRHGHGVWFMGGRNGAGGRYDGEWSGDKRDGVGTHWYCDCSKPWMAQGLVGGRIGGGADAEVNTEQSGSWDWETANLDTIAAAERRAAAFEYPEGAGRYEGAWRAGGRQGAGTYYYPNGDVYTGSWKEDERQDGDGIMQYGDHSRGPAPKGPNDVLLQERSRGQYSGQWLCSERSGKGVMLYATKDEYEGDWCHDQHHGIKGVMRYSDASVYSGPWDAHFPHGPGGRLLFANGDVFEGSWNADQHGARSWNGVPDDDDLARVGAPLAAQSNPGQPRELQGGALTAAALLSAARGSGRAHFCRADGMFGSLRCSGSGDVFHGYWRHCLAHGHCGWLCSTGSVYDSPYCPRPLPIDTATFDIVGAAEECVVEDIKEKERDWVQSAGGSSVAVRVRDDSWNTLQPCYMVYGNGDIYVGPWEGGRRCDAFGVMVYGSSGDRYEGDWVNCCRHGKGWLQAAHSPVSHCAGTTPYTAGATYNTSGGRMSGRFEGDWAFDRQSGYGRLISSGGDSYEGQWEAGRQCGRGTLQYNSDSTWYDITHTADTLESHFSVGDVFTGTFGGEGDRLDGCEGVMCYALNGHHYSGGWQREKRQGIGELTYTNGDQYIGPWVDGKRPPASVSVNCDQSDRAVSAEPSTVFTSGSVERGDRLFTQWRVEKTCGTTEGFLRYANLDEYQGEWDGSIRRGYGDMKYANGDVYRGQWQPWDGVNPDLLPTQADDNAADEAAATACKTISPNHGADCSPDGYGPASLGVHSGRGSITYSNGDTYCGEWERGCRHGRGTMVYKHDGNKWEGPWCDDIRADGAGVMVFGVSGDVYKGGWCTLLRDTRSTLQPVGTQGGDAGGVTDDFGLFGDLGDDDTVAPDVTSSSRTQNVPRGFSVDAGEGGLEGVCEEEVPGVMSWVSRGEEYTGPWSGDIPATCTYATMKYSNGDFYSGAFQSMLVSNLALAIDKTTGLPVAPAQKPFRDLSRRHGAAGRMQYARGDDYDGSWCDDLEDGEGSMDYANGDVYEGEWRKGVTCGSGKLSYANGDVFEGTFGKNHRLDGEGKMAYANGDVYKGNWISELRCGRGQCRYVNGDTFNGNWINDERESYQPDDKRVPEEKVHFAVDYHDWYGTSVADGNMVYDDASEYSGQWLSLARSGYGMMVYGNSHSQGKQGTYQGEWMEEKRHGTGRKRLDGGVEYEGGWADDVEHGPAALIDSAGNVFEGNWNMGTRVPGEGTMVYANGDKYVGQWIYPSLSEDDENHDPTHGVAGPRVPGVRSGKGTMCYANGDMYSGPWHNHERCPTDTGTMTYANGDEYVGAWIAGGIREGHGILIKAHGRGDKFEGAWKNDQPCGTGKKVYVNGDSYEGNWGPDGTKKGAGFMAYGNRDRYEGEWDNDLWHGQGTIVLRSGEKYTGQWAANLKSGSGILHLAAGGRIEADFFDDTIVDGEAIMRYANGDVYRGQWVNFLRSGTGRMEYNNGDTYQGEWFQGCKSGEGTMTLDGSSGDVYEGQWCLDKKHGQGKLRERNGDEYTGAFEDDTMHGEGEMRYLNGDVHTGTWKYGGRMKGQGGRSVGKSLFEG